MLTSKEIRQQFIEFFESKYNHTVVKSAPVAPLDDPTLLFTNAGMNQFKDVFIGTGTRPYTRAVDSQKVIRASGKHNDLDDVGVDTYHHTFFEMLGNWSFGDYFKQEAIEMAWDLITNVWKLPKDKLWATVYKDDHEAFELWKTCTDINPDHILYFDEKDNFWEMGATGPCGPCSEIHFDKGTAVGYTEGDPEKIYLGNDPKHGVNTENPQFMEIWNLVFMQYFRGEDGTLTDLPAKHVDTGMGFERIVAILQDKDSNYDTDVFTPLIQTVEDISGKAYNSRANSEIEMAMRVAVDHIRSVAFSVADGALPSNEGRGYVLRRMLRRASRYGRNLNLKDPFLYKLVDTLADQMGSIYPELNEKRDFIKKVIQSEEEQFNRTLDKGIERFNVLITDLESNNKTEVPGEEAFRLYDTFGFPLDLTEIMAKELGFSVDTDGFNSEMDAQKERARAAGKFNVSMEDKRNWITLSEGKHSVFVGYTQMEAQTEVYEYAIDGDTVYILLKETPFYAESGGQVGDKGTLNFADKSIEILDVKKEGDRFIHIGKYTGITPDKTVIAQVNHSNRRSVANNHTATHLVHKALKVVLGDHINQAGSLVEADRLRFDFNHFEKVTEDELLQIERIVNEEILKNTQLAVNEESYDDAIASGAMALFGEKYGDTVRTVQIGSFSKELCGGTHVSSTGQIGSFQIVSEGSISSGVRRIEAITGMKSFEKSLETRTQLHTLFNELSATPDQAVSKLKHLIDDKKALTKELDALKEEIAIARSSRLFDNVIELNGKTVIAERLDGINGKTLKTIGANLIQNKENTVIALASESDGKVALLVAVSNDLTKNYMAGKIVGEMAKCVGGGGGGRPDLATAGGKDATKIDDALELFKSKL